MADDPTPNDPPEPATDPAPNDPPADPKEPDYPADLGDAGKKALDAERKARRELEKRLKDLEPLAAKAKELEDAQKTEQQKLTEALEAAKADSATSKAEAARLRAAIKHGLSEDDLDLLGSGTPEEIEARAEKLAARLEGAKPKTVPASRRQGGGGGAPEESVERVVESIPRL